MGPGSPRTSPYIDRLRISTYVHAYARMTYYITNVRFLRQTGSIRELTRESRKPSSSLVRLIRIGSHFSVARGGESRCPTLEVRQHVSVEQNPWCHAIGTRTLPVLSQQTLTVTMHPAANGTTIRLGRDDIACGRPEYRSPQQTSGSRCPSAAGIRCDRYGLPVGYSDQGDRRGRLRCSYSRVLDVSCLCRCNAIRPAPSTRLPLSNPDRARCALASRIGVLRADGSDAAKQHSAILRRSVANSACRCLGCDTCRRRIPTFARRHTPGAPGVGVGRDFLQYRGTIAVLADTEYHRLPADSARLLTEPGHWRRRNR